MGFKSIAISRVNWSTTTWWNSSSRSSRHIEISSNKRADSLVTPPKIYTTLERCRSLTLKICTASRQTRLSKRSQSLRQLKASTCNSYTSRTKRSAKNSCTSPGNSHRRSNDRYNFNSLSADLRQIRCLLSTPMILGTATTSWSCKNQ